MIDSFLTSHRLCWWHTGNVGLLSKTEYATTNAQPTLKLTDAIELTCRIKRPELRNHSAGRKIPSERNLNPHSPLETHRQHRLRPGGSSPEHYPTAASNTDAIGEALLSGRHLIILNTTGSSVKNRVGVTYSAFAESAILRSTRLYEQGKGKPKKGCRYLGFTSSMASAMPEKLARLRRTENSQIDK